MADKMLKIELKKSLIGRGAKQIATAEALGRSGRFGGVRPFRSGSGRSAEHFAEYARMDL